MGKRWREEVAKKGIKEKNNTDDDQRFSNGPSGCLEDKKNGNEADPDISLGRCPYTKDEFPIIGCNVDPDKTT
jgi:hypothetical protein